MIFHVGNKVWWAVCNAETELNIFAVSPSIHSAIIQSIVTCGFKVWPMKRLVQEVLEATEMNSWGRFAGSFRSDRIKNKTYPDRCQTDHSAWHYDETTYMVWSCSENNIRQVAKEGPRVDSSRKKAPSKRVEGQDWSRNVEVLDPRRAVGRQGEMASGLVEFQGVL